MRKGWIQGGGNPPPLLGDPKFHKEVKNVVHVCANGLHFSLNKRLRRLF